MDSKTKNLDLEFTATEDLSNDWYRFVVLTATGVRRPNSAGEPCLGILQNAPTCGEAAIVRVAGRSKLESAGVLELDTFIMSEYVDEGESGRGTDAVLAVDRARAYVVKPADFRDDLAEVLLIGPVPAVTSTPPKLTVCTTKLTVVPDAGPGAGNYTLLNLDAIPH